jgi:hypothetical protein
MGKKKRYDGEELQDDVTMHKNSVKMRHILTKYPHISRRTIYDYINRKKYGLEVQKPGPKPILTEGIESNLHLWIVGMQTQGYPISRHMLLGKAQPDLQRDVRMYKISWISHNKLDSKVYIATPNVMLEDIPSSKEGKSRSQCQWHSRVLLRSCSRCCGDENYSGSTVQYG